MAYLAYIVESCQDAIVGKTLDGKVVSWNSGEEAIYGYSAAEMVGREVSVLVPSDRMNDLTQIYERVKRGERVERFETVRVRKNGTAVEASLTIFPLKDAQRKGVGASTVCLDISQNKN